MNLVPCCCHQALSFPAIHDISAGAFQRWPPEKQSVSLEANCKVIDTVTPGQLGVSKNWGAPKAWVSVLNDHKWPLLNDFGVPFLLRNHQQTNLTFPLHHVLPCALHLWATGSAQDSQAPQRHLRSARGVRPAFLPHRPEGWVTQLATSGNCWAVGLWSFAIFNPSVRSEDGWREKGKSQADRRESKVLDRFKFTRIVLDQGPYLQTSPNNMHKRS